MKNVFRTSIVGLLCIVLMASATKKPFLGSVDGTKGKVKMITAYVTFVDGRGHTIELYGRGQSNAGNITTFLYDDDNNGTVIGSGTASGTYDVTNQYTVAHYTPSGGTQLNYTGPATVTTN